MSKKKKDEESTTSAENTPVGGEVPIGGVAESGNVPSAEQDQGLKEFVKDQDKAPGQREGAAIGSGPEEDQPVHPSEVPTKPKVTKLHTFRSRYDFSSSLVLHDGSKVPYSFVDRTFTIGQALADHHGTSIEDLVEAMMRDTHMKRGECIQVAGPGFVPSEDTIKFERQVHQYLAENKRRVKVGSRSTSNE